MKIVTILGTRPEIIRLSSIIKRLEKNFNHILVNTGQNFDVNLNKIFFTQFKIKKPKYNLKCRNNTPAVFLADLFVRIEKILKLEKPDSILVLGDTNSALSTIIAKKYKIPIFHIEAGNRCFDQRVPEEINRKIVDHISDMNLTYSHYAYQNLINEGLHKDRIIKIGSPLLEVFEDNKYFIEKSNILNKLKLKKNHFILSSIHREENIENIDNLIEIFNSLEYLIKKFKIPVIFSTHPRTQKKLLKHKNLNSKNILFLKPFGYFEFIKLMKNAKFILSDSGSISEETSILSLPAVNIRNVNERQESMEQGTVIMSGLKKKSIIQSVDLMLKNFDGKKVIYPDYSYKDVSTTVVNILQSYTHYIMSKTWFK